MYRLHLGIGSALTAFGLCKLLSQLFLGNWERLSAGQSDIAARGVWLLAIFLPAFAILSAGGATALTAVITRGTGPGLLARALPALAGGIAGSIAIVLGLDPTVDLLRRVTSNWMFSALSISAAIMVLLCGLAIVLLGRRIQVAAA